MSRLIVLAAIVLGEMAIVSPTSTLAQVSMSEVPPEFFGAQRGRVVSRRDGRTFRMHYGRGLTPQGAAVLSNLITTAGNVFTVIGPRLFGAATAGEGAATQPARAPSDPILDALESSSKHATHMSELKAMLKTSDDLVVSLGGTASEPPPPPPKTVALKVRVHASVLPKWTNDRARAILQEMTKTLREKQEPPDDASLDREFVLDGNVEEFTTGTGIISSEKEFNDLLTKENADILVVRKILWCGGRLSGILGCANLNGSRLTAVPHDLENIIWAHEYGHLAGLDHRDEPRDDPKAVMTSFVDPTHRVINEFEHDAYTTRIEGRGPAAAQAPTLARPKTIDAFVKRQFIDGFPWEMARTYANNPANVGYLLDTLRNPKANEQHLASAVATLCAVGDSSVIPQIQKFIEPEKRAEPALTEKEFDAVYAGLLYLGHMYPRTKDKNIIPFLEKYLRADGPANRASLAARDVRTPVEPDYRLFGAAAYGLAFTGSPKARKILEGAMQPAAARFAPIREAGGSPMSVLEEALKVQIEIREDDPESVDRHYQQKRLPK